MTPKQSKKAPTLAELEEAYRVACGNLQRTLSGDYSEIPSWADELPTDPYGIEYAADAIGQYGYDHIADARDWLKAFQALAAARTKTKKAA